MVFSSFFDLMALKLFHFFRYESLTDASKLESAKELQINIIPDLEAKTLTMVTIMKALKEIVEEESLHIVTKSGAQTRL